MQQPSLRIPSPQALAANMDGEVVVLHLGTKRYFHLNETAAVIWAGLESGLASAGIVEQLRAEFDVTAEEAAAAVEALLAELESRSLVVAPPAAD